MILAIAISVFSFFVNNVVEPKARAETLSPQDYVRLARVVME